MVNKLCKLYTINRAFLCFVTDNEIMLILFYDCLDFVLWPQNNQNVLNNSVSYHDISCVVVFSFFKDTFHFYDHATYWFYIRNLTYPNSVNKYMRLRFCFSIFKVQMKSVYVVQILVPIVNSCCKIQCRFGGLIK